MRLRDILTGNTQHVIDEAALPPSAYALFNFLDQQGSTQLSTARRWNPRGVGRPRFNAFNGQVTELLRDPFVVANMLAALNMASDREPVVESAPDSGDTARAPRGRPPKRWLETEGPAMKLMQEQVRRAEAKTAALEKEKAALAEELRDAEATAAAKADGISSVTLDAALKAIRDALDRAKHQSEQASRNIDLIVGVDGSDLSMAELGVLSKVGDLVHLSAEVLDAAVASAPGLAQQLDELVATPRAKPELALIKRRRAFLKLLEVAKVRRTKGGEENVLPRHAAFAAMATGATAASVETRRRCMGDTISFAETWRFCKVAARLAKVAYPGLFPGRRVAFAGDNAQWAPLGAAAPEHFNSFETNPLLQSWFAIAWPLQTLPLEKTLRELGVQIKSSTRLQCELGVRSKPFVEVRAADFDIDAHSQPWLAKELGVLSVDGGYGRDLLKRTLYKLVWRHDPDAFAPAVFKKPRWTDAFKYRPEGPLQLEDDWKKDDVRSLEVQFHNTQKVPEVAEARLQALEWFGIGCGDPAKDWVIYVGDYVLYRNGLNAAGMTVAELSRLLDKRVVRTTAQLVALEAAETAAATPLAGPTGDAAAASTTVSAQPAAATPSTAVQEACMAWGFGRNEDVTQYKRAAKLDHGTGMTICRLARPNGINLLKYLVEHIDEPCFQGRNLSPLVVPPDIAATAESLEPARKSRPTASYRPTTPSFGLEPSVDPQAAQSGRLPRACTLRDASARGGDGGDADRFEEAGGGGGGEACYVCGDALSIAEPSIFCVGCGQKAHVNCVGQRSQGDHVCDECAETPRAPPPTSTLLSMRSHIDENQAKARRLDDLATRIAAARLAADDGGGATAADRRGDGGGDDDAARTAAATATAASTPPTRALRIHNLPGFWHLLEAGGIKVIFKLYYKSLLGRCARDVLKRKGITIKAAKFFQATELFYHVWEAMATALFRAHRKSQTFRESPVDLDAPEPYMDNFLEWYRAKRGTGDVPFVHYGGFVFGMGIYFRFCKKSISLKMPMLTFAPAHPPRRLRHHEQVQPQAPVLLQPRQVPDELGGRREGLARGVHGEPERRQHHAVSDAAQEIKQGEIQKSMGPKFGVAKVLIHSALNDLLSGVAKSFAAIATGDASAAAAGGRSKNAQADIAALVAHFEAHDIFNYEGPARMSVSSQYSDAEPEVDESDSDDDDARLRADAEAREAGD
ncbi:hypothetical protein JL722_10801 [Aureococcus anophagefferens]|nr:hypothetical protein JL722_10801 [Aureococcus anophagefferens]